MFSSCNGFLVNSSSFFSSLPDADGSPTIPSNQFFYVKISDATYRGSRGHDLLDYEMYERENGPGYDCKISKDEQNTTEDLVCMFEVLEGDLFLHQIVFEYNIPGGMCDYFSFRTHWHYNRATGQGPSTVYKREVPSEEVCILEGVSCVPAEGCENVTNSEGTVTGCKNKLVEKYCLNRSGNTINCKDLENITELCKFNDTENENENCCVGEYDVIDTSTGDKDKTDQDWGGDLRQCIGGLGRFAWPPEGLSQGHSQEGVPLPIITKAESGIRGRYELPAIIEVLERKVKKELVSRKYSLITANYFEGIEDGTGQPRFYKSDSGSSYSGHGAIDDGYPYITFACEDKAREVKHRIHLIIREWNSQAEFLEFKRGGSGDPDVAEKEGSECDYYEQEDDNIAGIYKEAEESCNDMYDVDDWKTIGDYHPKLEYVQ